MTVVTTCGRLHMSLQLPIYLLLVGVWLEPTGSVVTVHVAVAGVDLSGKGWNLFFLLSRCWGNFFFFFGTHGCEFGSRGMRIPKRYSTSGFLCGNETESYVDSRYLRGILIVWFPTWKPKEGSYADPRYLRGIFIGFLRGNQRWNPTWIPDTYVVSKE